VSKAHTGRRAGLVVTQALARVRKAAQQRRKEKFTALFHHLSLDLFREAFLVLKRDATRRTEP